MEPLRVLSTNIDKEPLNVPYGTHLQGPMQRTFKDSMKRFQIETLKVHYCVLKGSIKDSK